MQLSIGQIGRWPQAQHRPPRIDKDVPGTQCVHDLTGVRRVNGEEPGPTVGQQFQVMVDYGMSPLEAIQAATRNGAEALNRNDVGIIEVGRYGDLVAVDGDPLTDVRTLEKPAAVIKGGELIRPAN